MAKIRLKLDGLEDAQAAIDALAALPDMLTRQFAREMAKLGHVVEADLARRVPRQSGELAASARLRRSGATVRFGYYADYAPYVYYRQPRFRSRTVRQTLKKFRRSAAFRRLVNQAFRNALATTIARHRGATLRS